MISVLSFVHRGVRGALPAGKILQVEHLTNDESELISLWPGDPQRARHGISVATDLGQIQIDCDDLSLCKLERSAVVPLSELLRAVLGTLPHVVGLATFERSVAWLIDVRRLPKKLLVE